MSLQDLLTNIQEGDYVSAKKDFFNEVNERVEAKIELKKSAILEGDDSDDDESEDDDSDEDDKKDVNGYKKTSSNKSDDE